MADYEVGYGKPPKRTQFQPGQSGHPQGRTKGAKNVDSIMQKEADSKIPVTENGRIKKIRKAEVVIKQRWNKAAKGHDRASEWVVARMDLIELRQEQQPAGTLCEADRLQLANLQLVFELLQGAPEIEIPPGNPASGGPDGA